MPVLEFNADDRGIEREFIISKDARFPDLEVKLLDGNVPVDLSGATVAFSMEDSLSVLKVTLAVGDAPDGVDGIIRYQWAAADVDTVGRFTGQFKATKGGKDFLIPNNSNQRLRITIVNKVE